MNVGALTRASARHRVPVLLASAALLLLLGTGSTAIRFSDNPMDAMPRGDPHTEGSYELLERLPGSGYAAALYVTVAPERWDAANARLPHRVPLTSPAPAAPSPATPPAAVAGLLPAPAPAHQTFPGPHNITDEVYMRGMEELHLVLQARVPGLEWGITLPSQVKLVNYTNTGVPNPMPGQDALRRPDPGAFRLPDTSPEGSRQFAMAWQTFLTSSPESVRAITSSDWTTARLALLFRPGDMRLDQVGSAFYDAVAAYQDALRACDQGPCELAWPVFAAEDVIVDPRTPVAQASYLTRTTLADLVVLAPFAALFIVLCLGVAFRSPGTVAAMLLPMALAGFGVLGTFGLIGLPIHSVTLLVFPVLMGNGIDFAIHMANAYHRARSGGAERLAAAAAAGTRAGAPLALATLTTAVGMVLLLAGPNRLLSQLGLAILLGMAILLVVSLTALPAALSFTRTRPAQRDRMGHSMLRTARFWHRHRLAGIALVGVLSVAGVAAAGGLHTLIVGTPAAYFPEGDAQRNDFERSNELYFRDNEDLVTNGLVLRGDVTTPEAMDFLRRLEEGLRELPFVRDESALTLRFSLNAWIQVREGTAGAPLVVAQEAAAPGSTFPDDQDSIRGLVDEMFATPLATYASFFVNQPDENAGQYDISLALVEIYQADDLATLEGQWAALLAKVAEVEAEGEPSGLTVTVSGQTAVAYLFTAKELPYLQWASLLGIALTGLVVLAVRRDVRDAVTVAAVVAASAALWLGCLSLLEIPLSVALVVPVVILTAIGSDYALHLRHTLRTDRHEAWAIVGRAVLFSAITDLGAFLVFTQMRYGLLAQATVATAAALTCSLLATLVLVPALARADEVAPVMLPPRVPAVVRAEA